MNTNPNPEIQTESNKAYPKEKIALEHEKLMLQWLKSHVRKLPITLYSLNKELKWGDFGGYGLTRGTILRLKEKPESSVIIRDIIDIKSNRIKVKVALKNTPSEEILLKESAETTNNTQLNASKVTDEKKAKILRYLQKLIDIDNNIEKIACEITEIQTLERFLSFQFGLESRDKNDLIALIKELNIP